MIYQKLIAQVFHQIASENCDIYPRYIFSQERIVAEKVLFPSGLQIMKTAYKRNPNQQNLTYICYDLADQNSGHKKKFLGFGRYEN